MGPMIGISGAVANPATSEVSELGSPYPAVNCLVLVSSKGSSLPPQTATLPMEMSADRMPSEHHKPEVPIQDELPDVIRALRRPAGDDPRFQSDEGIRANRAEFLNRVHATWKQVHNRALEEILEIEGILTRDHRKQLPKQFVWFLDRTELIWRRVNDALVWLLVGQQDHVIRQLCHRKDRP